MTTRPFEPLMEQHTDAVVTDLLTGALAVHATEMVRLVNIPDVAATVIDAGRLAAKGGYVARYAAVLILRERDVNSRFRLWASAAIAVLAFVIVGLAAKVFA